RLRRAAHRRRAARPLGGGPRAPRSIRGLEPGSVLRARPELSATLHRRGCARRGPRGRTAEVMLVALVTKLVFASAATSLGTGTCSPPLTVQLQDASGPAVAN